MLQIRKPTAFWQHPPEAYNGALQRQQQASSKAHVPLQQQTPKQYPAAVSAVAPT